MGFDCIYFVLLRPRFGRGEGVVCVVLKHLDAALRDGDKVYATVRETRHLESLSEC